LRPDGKPLTLTIYVHANLLTTIDMMKLVTDYWKNLGIKAEVKPETNVLVGAKVQANEFEMQGFTISVGADGYSGDLTPNNNWCPLWYRWLSTNGKSGEEPPKEIKRLWQIFNDEFYSTTSEAKRTAMLKEAMRLHSDNLWIIGTVGVSWMMAIVKNNLRNVPESGFTWHPAAPGVFRLEQFFFKK